MVNYQRTRHWTFTVHFDKQLHEQQIKAQQDAYMEKLSKRPDYTYLIMGREWGENRTPHLQCYIVWKAQKRFETTVKILKGPKHVDVQQSKGTALQNQKYCSKEQEFFEFGTIPTTKGEAAALGGRKKAEQDRELLQHAEDGDFEWIKTHYPGKWIQDSAKLQALFVRKTEVLQGEQLPHEWWVGPTGCGKSKTVWELYPNHFDKQLNKWWDGYFNEDVVVIEEWCPKNDVTGSRLKVWADRYPFNAEIKGATLKNIRPKKIIVLSNYSMEQCFQNNEDLQPMKRKFRQIHWGETKLQQEATKAKIKEYAEDFYNGLIQEEEEDVGVGSVESQTIASPDSTQVPEWMNWDWGTIDMDTTILDNII